MKPSTETDYKTRILRVLIYIQQHLDEAVCLDDLAALAHFSPFHFHRIFRGMVGEGVMEHVRRLRLERAAHLLRHSAQPVTGIAFGAGYETLDAFIRAFRTMFGCPPTTYRENEKLKMKKPSTPPLPAGGIGGASSVGGIAEMENSVSTIHYHPDQPLNDFEPYPYGALTMDVEIRTLSPQKVAFVRHVGPYADGKIGQTWGKLCSWAGPRGLLGPQTRFIGISHDDPEVTPPEKIRYDACTTLSREVQPEGDIGVQEIPGGEYVMALHRGPYEKLYETYAALCGGWIPRQGYRLKPDHGFEIYRNTPDRTPPDELLTEIYLPVEKA